MQEGHVWSLKYSFRLSREQRWSYKCCSPCGKVKGSHLVRVSRATHLLQLKHWWEWERRWIMDGWLVRSSEIISSDSNLFIVHTNWNWNFSSRITWILPCPSRPQLWRTVGRGLVPGWWDSHSSDPWTLRWPWWSGRCTEAPCLLVLRYSFCQWWPGCTGWAHRLQWPQRQKHQEVSIPSVIPQTICF